MSKVKEAAPPESPPLPPPESPEADTKMRKGENEDMTPSYTREIDHVSRFLYRKLLQPG